MHSNTQISSTMKNRKTSKPIMEKKRRARFNASLAELESLLAEVKKQEETRQSKMEKADILEMTVRYVKRLHSKIETGSTNDESPIANKYRLGFNRCASEVGNFLKSVDGLNPEIYTTLLQHLANRNIPETSKTSTDSPHKHQSAKYTPYDMNNNYAMNKNISVNNRSPNAHSGNEHVAYSNIQTNECRKTDCAKENYSVNGGVSQQNQTNSVVANSQQGQIIQNTQTVPNVFNGLQLIPTKLTSGQIAFIIPATNVVQGNPIQNYVMPCNVLSNVQVTNEVFSNSSSCAPQPVNSTCYQTTGPEIVRQTTIQSIVQPVTSKPSVPTLHVSRDSIPIVPKESVIQNQQLCVSNHTRNIDKKTDEVLLEQSISSDMVFSGKKLDSLVQREILTFSKSNTIVDNNTVWRPW